MDGALSVGRPIKTPSVRNGNRDAMVADRTDAASELRMRRDIPYNGKHG